MRTRFVLPALFALVVALAAPAAADTYSPTRFAQPGNFGVHLVEDFASTGEGVSRILRMDPGDNGNQYLCERIGIAPCDLPQSASVQYAATLVLPVCSEHGEGQCIESLQLEHDGVAHSASFVRATTGEAVQAQPEFGLPHGGTISLWDVPAVPHAGGGTQYAVYAATGVATPAGQLAFDPFGLRVSVVPYTQRSGAQFQARAMQQETASDGRKFVGQRGTSAPCIWVEDGLCGVEQNFVADTRVTLTLRAHNTMTGWLRGRLQAPDIRVEPINGTFNRLTVSGDVVDVAKFYGETPFGSLSPDMRRRVPQQQSDPRVGATINMLTSDEPAFEVIREFRDAVGDKSAGRQVMWSFGSVQAGVGSGCLADRSQLLGLVTTNAMVFEGAAPSFNDGFLKYRVAGMHYSSLGEVQAGTYDLAIRSTVARCLYGFTAAPISASIDVLGEGGEKRVATTVVREADGWLRLSASGFTFSSPTVQVKLAQAAGATPTLPVVKKKTTITCVKGKIVKKVTAIAPKCPVGFKKR